MTLRLKDVMLDSEPIGLAGEFSPIEEALLVELECDDSAAEGSEVYFGLSLPIEEIAEVKGLVEKSEEADGKWIVSLKVLAADSQYKAMAVKTLSGAVEASSEGGAGPMWAKGLKQSNGAYAFLVNAPAGLLTADQLAGVANVAKRNAGVVKLTHAQRIVILASQANLESVESELGELGLKIGVLHHGVRNIRACCGSLCKWAKGVDAIKAAIELDKELFGKGTNFDVKIAVSDCLRNCSESYCADIGVLGGDGSYKIVVGGRGSQVPFRAIHLASGVKPEELSATVSKVVDWYLKTAKPKERLWKTLERLGSDSVKDFDAGAIKKSLEQFPDGVDETERLKSQVARSAGAAQARKELGLTA